jgi:DNA polymerase-1
MRPTKEAYKLMHEGALALTDVEANGVCIDTGYLDRQITKVAEKIDAVDRKLREDEVWKVWKKNYGASANLNSRVQLGEVLFGKMGFECQKRTKTKRPVTDDEELQKIDHPFVVRYLRVAKLRKLHGTYLKGIRREVVDGVLHAFYNLHLAATYRSSSDSPNFQNIPVRNAFIRRLIRRAFIPRPGHILVEVDYGQLEVCIAACYHHDPTMLKYIQDKQDLHRDMAAELFMCDREDVSKDARYSAKNRFVFPQFYGDWYAPCARHIWGLIDRLEVKTQAGVPMKEWLAAKGIEGLGECSVKGDPVVGTFEEHVQEVERDFWETRFSVYAQWKKEWVEAYTQQGWIQMLTGFVVRGALSRNEIINYSVQGSAFHCLLWSLIRLNRWLKRQKMKSMIVGQIHDSMLLDVAEEELDDVLGMARQVMVDDLRREWKWIVVPLEVEFEGSRLNWYEKEEIGAGMAV